MISLIVVGYDLVRCVCFELQIHSKISSAANEVLLGQKENTSKFLERMWAKV